MPNPGPRSVAPRSPWLLPPAASVPWSCWEIHLGEHASAALRKSPERDTATPTASRLRLLPLPTPLPPMLLVLTPVSPPLLQRPPGLFTFMKPSNMCKPSPAQPCCPPAITAPDGSPGTSCAWRSALLKPGCNHPLTQTRPPYPARAGRRR